MGPQCGRDVDGTVVPRSHDHTFDAPGEQYPCRRIGQRVQLTGVNYQQDVATPPGRRLRPCDHLTRERAGSDAVGDKAKRM